ncbi:MAG: phosphoribosylformylglycinamidine cyclo-ligase [Deltaproteobacteria bacterium]|nr:phosphoribosylformylglycinamidine cyclo-ligase [Deltaproteobacteria bacterium]
MPARSSRGKAIRRRGQAAATGRGAIRRRRPRPRPETTYAQAGVDSAQEEHGLRRLVRQIEASFALRPDVGAPRLKVGYFANVLDLGGNRGLAISTDGVGTKLLVAQMLGKFDTIGIDCVAMNVNDVLCVGAEPLAMVDYIGIERMDPDLLEEVGKGLYAGARQARITIPGGEIAQLPEMVRGHPGSVGFDLVGTCVGVVALDRVLVGQGIDEGDAVIGLRSSGIHSNGLTLARRVLLHSARYQVRTLVSELGRTVGEELLEPTIIYVPEVLDMLRAGLRVKALVHITGDGLLNLARVEAETGVVLSRLPEPPPVFRLIQREGRISNEEMYRVFNMGVGFCVIVAPGDAGAVQSIARRHRREAIELGCCVKDPARRVRLEPLGLVGEAGRFRQA